MTASDDRPEIGDGDAGVERGGRQATMAEQGRDVTEIGAATQQMRGAGVSRRVGREPEAEATIT